MAVDSPDISDLSLNEKIAFLEEGLPTPIRDFLHSPARDATSLRLSQQYQLHADQAAAFERAYLYMLLGVNSPHDFVQDLKDVGIHPDTIRGLTNDINEQVFKKLMRKELEEKPKVAFPTQPTPPRVPVLQVKPQIPTSAPQQKTPSVNLIDKRISVPEPVMRTMQHDMELIQHGRQPAPYPAPNNLHPTQATPARMFQTASVPVTAPPAQTQPAYEMIHVIPDPSPAPQTKPHISVQPAAQIATIATDPYREPI